MGAGGALLSGSRTRLPGIPCQRDGVGYLLPTSGISRHGLTLPSMDVDTVRMRSVVSGDLGSRHPAEERERGGDDRQ